MNTQERKPARAAAAPTAPARLPVEEQERVVKPKARAASTAIGDDPVLEGVRRVAGVVLDVQPAGDAQLAGEVVGLDELGEAGVEVGLVGHVGGDGQQRRVAPDVRPARPRSACAGPRGRRSAGRTRPRAGRNTPAQAKIGPRAKRCAALAAGQCGGGTESDGCGGGARSTVAQPWRRGPFSSSSSRRISPRDGFGTFPSREPRAR